MTAETCIAAAQASCDRLGVDCIDLYYVHRFHPKVSAEQQARAMLAVKEAGLATHIGVSEFSPNRYTLSASCQRTAARALGQSYPEISVYLKIHVIQGAAPSVCNDQPASHPDPVHAANVRCVCGCSLRAFHSVCPVTCIQNEW
jgi:hypothetical protein